MKIRKAALLAAGRGTRLGALTAETTKPLLEVARAPILAHIIGALAHAGVEEFIVVCGHLAEQVESFCAALARAHRALSIVVVRQPRLDGTAGAMLAAAPMLSGEQGFIFGWGDVLMQPDNYWRFLRPARAEPYDLLLAVNQVDDPCRGAAVYVDERMRVVRLVEKPAPGSSRTNWNNAGLFAAHPGLFDYLRRLRPSARGESEVPAAIAAMIEDGLQVRAVEVRGFWSDVGTPGDLAQARERFRPGLKGGP